MKFLHRKALSFFVLFMLMLSALAFAKCPCQASSSSSSSSSEKPKKNKKPLKWFIVLYENASFDLALTSPDFASFANKGTLFTNFHAVTHPSLPNYLALIAGDTFCCLTPSEACPGEPTCTTLPPCSDDNQNLDFTTIVDLLEKKGLSWKAYMENLPSPGYTGTDFLSIDIAITGNPQCCSGNFPVCESVLSNYTPYLLTSQMYARKHNPFINFTTISGNPKRAKKIVNANEFFKDILQGDLADYIFYVPNQLNDGHDTPITEPNYLGFDPSQPCPNPPNFTAFYSGEAFTRTFTLPFGNKKFMKDRVVCVVFDEGDDPVCTTNPNQIYCVFFGDMVKKGKKINTNYNHFNLLRTIEDTMHIGTLGRNDSLAAPMKGWRKKK